VAERAASDFLARVGGELRDNAGRSGDVYGPPVGRRAIAAHRQEADVSLRAILALAIDIPLFLILPGARTFALAAPYVFIIALLYLLIKLNIKIKLLISLNE